MRSARHAMMATNEMPPNPETGIVAWENAFDGIQDV